MIKSIVKILAYLTSKVFSFNVVEKIKWYENLFYTYWLKNNFGKCEGRICKSIDLKGGKNIFIGHNSSIESGNRLHAFTNYNNQKFNPKIIIGDNVLISKDCFISCINNITIGNNVAIGARCLIVDNVHGNFNFNSFSFNNNIGVPDVFLNKVSDRQLYSKGPVFIEENVHIGENCTIMPGVSIGKNSVIASNSFISKSIDPFSIVFGNPAKSICLKP